MEQVPPDKGPNQGDSHHAKSRIGIYAARRGLISRLIMSDSSALLLPRYSEAVTLLP
jgi:hypothetical protein